MAGSALEQKRLAYSQALSVALEGVLEQLSSMPQVHRVILFGSYAAGRRDLFTDLDLLVVMDSEQDFVQRTAELYGQLSVGVDVDLLAYTPEEFERMRHSGFVRHAVKKGQVLYEKKRS